jgi:hypothetical protein
MRKRILAVLAALGTGLGAGIAVMVILLFMIGRIEEGLLDLLVNQLEVYLPLCLVASILTQIINRPNGGRAVGLGVGAAGAILVPILIFGVEVFYSLTEMISILYALAITLPLGYEAGSITQNIACSNGQ